MKTGPRLFLWWLTFSIIIVPIAGILGSFGTGISISLILGVVIGIFGLIEIASIKQDEKKKIKRDQEKFLERQRMKELRKKWEKEYKEGKPLSNR